VPPKKTVAAESFISTIILFLAFPLLLLLPLIDDARMNHSYPSSTSCHVYTGKPLPLGRRDEKVAIQEINYSHQPRETLIVSSERRRIRFDG